MTNKRVLIQILEYPRKKSKSRSLIIEGEEYLSAFARIEYLYSELAENERVTITHVK